MWSPPLTYIDVYISSAKSRDSMGVRISPLFPNGRQHSGSIDKFAGNIGRRKIQLDWGSYCYPMNKDEVIQCIETVYRNAPEFNDPDKILKWNGYRHHIEQLDGLLRFCATLDDAGAYAIVWSEL